MGEQENRVKTEEQLCSETSENTESVKSTDSNGVIEIYIKKLLENKNKLCVFLLSLISAVCSFMFLAEMKLNGMTMIYTLMMIIAAAGNAVYALNVDKKIPHVNDFVVCGTAACLLGMILRTIRMGIIFSVQYFIAYLVFGIVLVFVLLQLGKNQGKSKITMIMLGILAFYDVVEFFMSGYADFGFIWKIYHISEALLFSGYICILHAQQKETEAFSEKVGNYKTQIPSVKICVLILVFVAAFSFAIGCVKDVSNKKKSVVTQIVTEKTAEKMPEQEKPVTNKASGTVSSGESATEAKTVPAAEEKAQSAKAEAKPIALGETVATEHYEFTLNKVELSYDVEPDNPPSYYTHYAAGQGQVYIYVNASVKNTGKHSLECDEIYSVTADYNNGYTYRGFAIASDTDGDFTYANITSVEPLQTLGVHCLIDCPEEVETTENPLKLTIKMKDGTEYLYTVR